MSLGEGEGDSATLEKHDAAELFGPGLVTITSPEGEQAPTVHALIVEMAFTGPGRSDL